VKHGFLGARGVFGCGRAAAALLLLTVVCASNAVASPEPDAARLVAEHAEITAKRLLIIQSMKSNLALKRSIENDYRAVDADTERYRRDVREATAFCTGRFDDEEYRRRTAICQQKQRELDQRHEEIEARRKDLARRDKARQAEAVKLKASYDALGQRATTIEDSISEASPFAGVAQRCRKEEKDADAISQCIDRGWAEAAGEVRDYLNLETGEAFTQGVDWREQIDAKQWPLSDKIQATLAVLLADTGRYAEAARLMGSVAQRKPGDPFLESATATFLQLAQGRAGHTGVSGAARDVLAELKISHLSPAAQVDVLQGILLFREGDYDGAVNRFGAARRRHPSDVGLQDMSFLVGQAVAARVGAKPGPTRAARLFQREGVLAAEGLAVFLMECGDTPKAELALGVTRERLSKAMKAMPSPDPIDLANLGSVERMGARLRDEGTQSMTRPAGRRYFDGLSKADLMLDALSFGQKSWDSSLRYLEIARAADPGNPRIREAYDELAAIARKAASP